MQETITENGLTDFPCVFLERNAIFQAHQILATELYDSAVGWERGVLGRIANAQRDLTYDEETIFIEICHNLIENSFSGSNRTELLIKLPKEAIENFVGLVR